MRHALLLSASCLLLATSAVAQVSATIHFETRPGAEYGNRYLVSYPHARPIPDVANSDQLDSDKCDIATIGPDGVINADDLICWTWGAGDNSARVGTFQISTWDAAHCRPISRTAVHVLGTVHFLGTPFPFDPTVGYRIDLAPASDGTQQDFTKTFVDDCSPAFAPKTYAAATACPFEVIGYLWVPYDYAKQVSIGMLCANTTCDDLACRHVGPCTGGLFPAATGGATAVYTYRHVPDQPWSVAQAETVAQVLGQDRVAGTNTPVVPGDSYALASHPRNIAITWDPQRVTCSGGNR